MTPTLFIMFSILSYINAQSESLLSSIVPSQARIEEKLLLKSVENHELLSVGMQKRSRTVLVKYLCCVLCFVTQCSSECGQNRLEIRQE